MKVHFILILPAASMVDRLGLLKVFSFEVLGQQEEATTNVEGGNGSTGGQRTWLVK